MFQTDILESLPPIYATAGDSLLAQLVATLALELECVQEDTDRMRQAHWVNFAYRLPDLEKIAALMGVARLPWETLPLLRARLLALVAARRHGALGPNEIKQFTFDYLRRAERALGAVFVPGLARIRAEEFRRAFDPPTVESTFRPLVLAENPLKRRHSTTLMARGGRVPALFRWEESNRGLEETMPAFSLTGFPDGRTAVPILINLTSGELIGFRGVLRVGRTLTISAPEDTDAARGAIGAIDGRDVTDSLFSLSGFRPGVPFAPSSLDPQPRLPRMARGTNRWIFLSVGLYDVDGLDHYAYAMADEQLGEGVFDRTFFDHALFPAGPVAGLRMEWREREPASFEVRVPRYLTIEPAGRGGEATPVHERVAAALRLSIQQLHAAGVRAEVHFEPFQATQPQRVRVELPWVVTEPERGSAGRGDTVSVGGRFGESGLGTSRYE